MVFFLRRELITFNALDTQITYFQKLMTWQLVCYKPLDLIETNGQKKGVT